MKPRYLTEHIISDLSDKMVFIGGARQIGKTTLAKEIIAYRFSHYVYYNWDDRGDRRKILNSELPGTDGLLIFDEIHKYRNWKNLVKGVFDKYKHRYKILVTGSARLNVFRKGGDSLLGRYRYYNLFPFSLAETQNLKNDVNIFEELPIGSKSYNKDLRTLDKFGGFPEMFLKQDDRNLRRWHNEKLDRLFREEIRDIEAIRDISNMQILADMLPDKVGSLLSINSLRNDLEVSHRAVTHWLNILENFYYVFRIHPYYQKSIRSIKKEPKLYLYDWSEVNDEAARFENLIASHLWKYTKYLYDYYGYKSNLHFLRNVDKKEVDFLVSIDNKPWFCLEVKLNDESISPAVTLFKERLKIPFAYQVIKKKEIDFFKKDVRVISADKFLSGLI